MLPLPAPLAFACRLTGKKERLRELIEAIVRDCIKDLLGDNDVKKLHGSVHHSCSSPSHLFIVLQPSKSFGS
jgi:hypothetical protein